MTTAFRLLDLPFLPLENVISYLSVLDIFDFSLCSRKCENIVISATTLPKFKIGISFGLEKVKTKNSLRFEGERNKYLGGWTFDDYYNSKKCKEKRIIGGIPIRFCKGGYSGFSRYSGYSSCFKRYQNVEMKIIIDRFVHLFKCSFGQITLETGKFPSSLQESFFEKIDKCESLRIHGSYIVSQEDFDFFRSKVTVTKCLTLCVPVLQSAGEVIPPKPLKLIADKVNLDNYWMITSEQLLESDCAEMNFFIPNCTNEIIEQFIFQWFNSTNKRLKDVRITRNTFQLNLEQFGGRGWSSNERNRYYPTSEWQCLDCSRGTDILRADGLLATILVDSYTFRMIVWHERFPIVTQRQLNNKHFYI